MLVFSFGIGFHSISWLYGVYMCLLWWTTVQYGWYGFMFGYVALLVYSTTNVMVSWNWLYLIIIQVLLLHWINFTLFSTDVVLVFMLWELVSLTFVYLLSSNLLLVSIYLLQTSILLITSLLLIVSTLSIAGLVASSTWSSLVLVLSVGWVRLYCFPLTVLVVVCYVYVNLQYISISSGLVLTLLYYGILHLVYGWCVEFVVVSWWWCLQSYVLTLLVSFTSRPISTVLLLY